MPATDPMQASERDLAAVWRAIGSVVDPEVPVVSVVELGIVRSVEREAAAWVITLTPTYSGCPATRVIENDIRMAIAAAVGEPSRVVTALAPAWTTDWIAPEALSKLRAAGIAPPGTMASNLPGAMASITPPGAGASNDATVSARPVTFSRPRPAIPCPNCGSLRTAELARFGSTACKAQYRCADCLEPFDYFKPH
ncbi:MAG TPA: 1,2-phenylacetyl-CoA epoxidase subunit PaaD [Casimicrobiaceae bacterium]|nr:1,2-phenylacetyl-CoA epoxidase subunit PaaD [Casimicrobiaceae bacterium]